MPLLTSLTAGQRSDLCTALKPRIFNAGESIVRKGEPGEAFYIVESGTCTVLGDAGQVLPNLPINLPVNLPIGLPINMPVELPAGADLCLSFRQSAAANHCTFQHLPISLHAMLVMLPTLPVKCSCKSPSHASRLEAVCLLTHACCALNMKAYRRSVYNVQSCEMRGSKSCHMVQRCSSHISVPIGCA